MLVAAVDPHRHVVVVSTTVIIQETLLQSKYSQNKTKKYIYLYVPTCVMMYLYKNRGEEMFRIFFYNLILFSVFRSLSFVFIT